MVSKILGYQIVFLFLLTLLAFFGFYYADSLPDNYLQITSAGQDFSYITYYLSSFLASIEFYLGPWIFFLFLAQLVLHASVFSSRLLKMDVAAPLIMAPLFLLISYALVPDLVGEGPQYLIR